MSVCSAAAAATRPGIRRETRGSSTRASTSEARLFRDRSYRQQMESRKCSTVSSSKSSGKLCCVISVLVTVLVVGWFDIFIEIG